MNNCQFPFHPELDATILYDQPNMTHIVTISWKQDGAELITKGFSSRGRPLDIQYDVMLCWIQEQYDNFSSWTGEDVCQK